jgi:hypothetical protein
MKGVEHQNSVLRMSGKIIDLPIQQKVSLDLMRKEERASKEIPMLCRVFSEQDGVHYEKNYRGGIHRVFCG